jgi:hypothetical protein
MKNWTRDELRARFPKLTEGQIEKLMALLKRKPATVREIWAGEDQRGDEPQAIGPDGLTEQMREINRFADENALGIPFPPKT